MAAAIGFTSCISGQSLPPKGTSYSSLRITKSIRSNPVKITMIDTHPTKATKKLSAAPSSSTFDKSSLSTHTTKATKKNSLKLFATSTSDTSSYSPAQTIMRFYSAINEKNLRKLDKYIAEGCYFEDYSFPKPFQGKKEVMKFLEQLTMCMGDYKNMQFKVELLCEGNDYTVAVNWHLEWKKIKVPFTRGCSYFSLAVNDDKLVIKKAQVLIESPIKLGLVALAIFKTVSSLFDAFPSATEWFLKSPHTMLRLLLKGYKIGVQPIVTPFLAWYINLLNFAACILSNTLKVLYYLAKFFH